ncbi:NAD-dependent dehydratase [Niastella yeongjuensis]|uniref:NAD-dependent dehydratase n=1 Tax=Niastella yeongjuensis TaxID=354355 RepID=A0A1V9EJH9_9BACT|nr:NAD(P)H-binding protein [Niastella yeongjuensis]OQP46286.1 NAD-dependent dehydratase [Niastella yeongjuensis]SEP45927.1 Uncharacterized conserved protein YbjT, contains NAD(P)-binding and DUF2867 domains [Niastella yeongjuensis]
MKIIVTGSLGNISKPLTEILVKNGHEVTVISSKAEKKNAIAALGAKAAIGSFEDIKFLTETFKGADAVYVMEANDVSQFFNPEFDAIAYNIQIAKNYKEAIAASGVEKVIHLSCIGGHTDKGVGLVALHHGAETALNELPANVQIKFMRPVGFYYNLLQFIPAIKGHGMIFANYGGDEKEPMAAVQDIADTIAEEFDKPFTGRTVQYIASDEVSMKDVAKEIGKAIGIPDMPWVQVPDQDFYNTLLGFGMSPQGAHAFTELNTARRTGLMYEDYINHKPQLGKVKIADYAKEFAAIYNHQ